MGIFSIGLARLLEVGGALSRGPQADRLQLPRDGDRRARWSRDEFGLFKWSGMPRRGATEAGIAHGSERASSRSVA
jgi:hypothetical protein